MRAQTLDGRALASAARRIERLFPDAGEVHNPSQTTKHVSVLCGDTPKLSRQFLSNRGRRLLRALSIGALALLPATAWASSHHRSKIHFVEHSPEVFERARREGKPVFLLISAVWCYWCKYFDQNTLETAEVAAYLNAHYLSVFVDPDRRTDVARRYLRGLPMIVLLDPYGQVRQSFAGALTKEDFLSILKRVEAEIRNDLARGVARPPAERTVALPRCRQRPSATSNSAGGCWAFWMNTWTQSTEASGPATSTRLRGYWPTSWNAMRRRRIAAI